MPFRGNGGSELYYKFDENLAVLANPKYWPDVSSALGFTILLAVLGYRWIDDRFVRRALWVLAPFFVFAMIYGRLVELRIYGELLPLTLGATLLAAKRVIELHRG